ncbi:MAG: helix-turn-helix transcriptional regulator [Acidimicrobiales bacterium]
MSDPTARTLSLLSLLQTHRHWKGSALAGRLGVSERTVRRDVDRLRTLGYPVDAGPGIGGGYRLAVGAHLPPLLLDDDEAVALVVGLQTAAGAAIEGIEDTTVALMAKLDRILPGRLRRRVDALRHSLEVMSWTPTSAVPAASLTVLSQACRHREEVRFDYQRRDGEESRRLVQPYHLMSVGRRWYLVAWDVRRDDWRLFRVDRMATPTLAGGRFEPRRLPTDDVATFVTYGLRAFTAEYRATVVVDGVGGEIDGVARWLGAETVAVDGGRTTIELRSDNREWLASMIATVAVGGDVTVVDAPNEVRALLGHLAARLGRAADPPS